MYIRVRTTSVNRAPAFCSARSIFFKVCTACAYASPMPTIFPCASVAVVPDTHTFAPTRTAREYPITGSQGVPLEIFVRAIKSLPVEFRPNQSHRPRFSILYFRFSIFRRSTDQIAPAIPPAQSDTNPRACQTPDTESAPQSRTLNRATPAAPHSIPPPARSTRRPSAEKYARTPPTAPATPHRASEPPRYPATQPAAPPPPAPKT